MNSADPRSATADAAPAEDPLPVATSPILDAGGDAYYRDLAELLKTHPGWWVAYYGPERVALAPTYMEVRRLCRNRSFDWSVLWISRIEPEHSWDYVDTRPPVDWR